MLPGSTAMSQCTPAPPLSFAFLLSHANTRRKKKILHQFFESSPNPILAPPVLSHFGLISFLLPGEPVPECRRYVQVRNITKGDCRLDNVEVSFCRGRCLSRTDVTLEVRS